MQLSVLCYVWHYFKNITCCPIADQQPNGAGKLDHSHPLSMRRCRRPSASQRRHSSTAAFRDQEAGAEDRHGREDEEDGGNAALSRHRHQEAEDHPRTSRFQGKPVGRTLFCLSIYFEIKVLLIKEINTVEAIFGVNRN